MSDIEEIFQEINSKLSVLISLSLMEKDINLRQRIIIMVNAGLKNLEIAKILGISQVYVAKEKSLAKKGKKMDEKQFNQLSNILKDIRDHEKFISKKLNLLIKPIFKRESKKQDKKTTQISIKMLNDCGLDYKEIADILNMSSGTIANELTILKSKIRRKNG